MLDVDLAENDAGSFADPLAFIEVIVADRREHIDASPEGVEVLRLGESPALHELFVVGRVVRHHKVGRGIETFDQQADGMVHRRIHRAADGCAPLGFEPGGRRVEQSVGDSLVIDTLEEAEEADPVVVALEMPNIVDRGDSPDDLFAALRQKGLNAVAFVERGFFEPDQFLFVHADGGDPVGIVFVELPWKVQKGATLPEAPRLDDANFFHRYFFL